MNLKSILARLTAISIVVSTIGYSTPVKSNPTAIIAPALCSTGAGCIFLGIVAVGGVAYYVWQHNNSGQQFYSPIVDNENPGGWEVGKTMTVFDPNRCREIAQRENKNLIKILRKEDVSGGVYYVCVFK